MSHVKLGSSEWPIKTYLAHPVLLGKKICPLKEVKLVYVKGFPAEWDKPNVLRQDSLNIWPFFNRRSGRWG